jgi:hypothetical protein
MTAPPVPAVRHVQTDILILGSGGAGLFAALHAHQRAPDLKITVAVKGLLGKCGCTRMVQGGYNVALAAGDSVERHFMDTIDGSKWLADQDLAWTLVSTAVERIRELENELGCFFDRNPDGSVHQKAFAGPDLRPHGAQGRPDRHRDHQPPGRAGVGAWHRPPGGAPRHRTGEDARRRRAGRRADDRHAQRRLRVRAGARRAAGHRRRPDHVQVPHAVGRQELRRPGDGAARRPARCATWRWCSSIRPACWRAAARA